MNKKGNAIGYIFFMFTAIIIVMIAAVMAPFGVKVNTAFYEAGEKVLASAQSDIADIDNPEVRNQINSTVTEAQESSQQNIAVNANIFQYSWIGVVLITAIGFFFIFRSVANFNRGGIV